MTTQEQQDDLDKANELLKRGKGITMKRLAAHMPETAQDLREGTLAPSELASRMQQVYFNRTASGPDSSEYIPEGDSFVGPADLCPHLAMMAWPNLCFGEDNLSDSEAQMVFRFASDIEDLNRSALHCLIDDLGDKQAAMHQWSQGGMKHLQNTVEQACRKWAKRMDRKFYNGKKGSFLRQCMIYGLSEDAWRKDVLEVLFSKGDENRKKAMAKSELVKKQTELAAYSVSYEIDKVWTVCWECDQKFASSALSACSRCSVALYCGPACQRAAWYGGHKSSCKLHKRKINALQKEFETVDSMFESEKLGCVFANEDVDYRLCEALFHFDEPGERARLFDSIASDIQGPSMEIYYRNLTAIAHGDWWLFATPDDKTVYVEKVDAGGEEAPLTALQGDLHKLLAFDIPEYLTRTLGKETIGSEDVETLLKDMGSELMSVAYEANLFPPVERFFRRNSPTGDAKYRTSVKKLVKGLFIRHHLKAIHGK